MFKTSKLFDTLMIILFLSFIGLIGYLAIEMKQAEKANNSQVSELLAFEFKVSEVTPEGIHGNSLLDETGIFFTFDKLQHDQKVNEGDVIKVYFNKVDLQEGIEHIEVITNGQ